MSGIRPLNFRAADRAEYFALWGLSSIAQVIPVPRQEDYGIDLFYGLTRMDKDELIIEDVFGVQVKKMQENLKIAYGGKNRRNEWKKREIEWLLFKQNYPLIILVADTDGQKLDIFSTSRMWYVRWQIGYAYQINLIPYANFDISHKPDKKLDREDHLKAFGDRNIWSVPLGKPIISINLDNLMNEHKMKELYNIFKKWIDLDQENVTYQLLNIPFYQNYIEWETNVMPDFNKKRSKVFGSTKPSQAIDNIFRMIKSMMPMIDALQFQLHLSKDDDSKIVNEFYRFLNKIIRLKS
jgi:hypothetical protein